MTTVPRTLKALTSKRHFSVVILQYQAVSEYLAILGARYASPCVSAAFRGANRAPAGVLGASHSFKSTVEKHTIIHVGRDCTRPVVTATEE